MLFTYMWKIIAIVTKIDSEFSTVIIILKSPEAEIVVEQISVCRTFFVVVVYMREPELAPKLLD